MVFLLTFLLYLLLIMQCHSFKWHNHISVSVSFLNKKHKISCDRICLGIYSMLFQNITLMSLAQTYILYDGKVENGVLRKAQFNNTLL